MALAPTIAAAQTGGGEANPGGLQIDIGVSSGLTYDSNLSLDPGGEDAAVWDTGLTFALSSVTGAQRFDVTASGVLRYIDTGSDSDFGLEDTRLRFGYQRESLNSRLTLSASYSDVDRDFIDPFADSSDSSSSSGSIATTSAALRYETGLQDPLGFWIDLSHRKVDYSDTDPTDTDLTDNQTDRAEIATRMRLSAVSTVTVSATGTWYDETGATPLDRTTTEYLARLEHEIDPVLSLDLGIGHDRIEETESGVTTVTSGAVGFIGLERAMTNGTANARLATTLDDEGRRTELTFGREMELPRGTFAASIGASRAPDGEVDAIGSVTYTRSTRTGELSVGLERTAYTDDGDNTTDTRVSLGYRHQINEVSRLDLGLAWSLVDASNGGVEDETEYARLSAAYSRDLTADWDLTSGVTYRTRSESGIDDAHSTAIFVTLSRNFSYRP
ncbi:hypothetical protein [Defluviimonas sp. WL0075]|uniref:Outer membrane beta-barrel protein n=1 Tax=Albidovulum sediminicola TaxID=2984331 RepID=A0ABT2YWR6_9RHOB|nr:hypothetical protein [Defluviimonas sp. WL0075]MCV2863301.1 hypothetical protein [Defluviimonas sp. WL0075]